MDYKLGADGLTIKVGRNGHLAISDYYWSPPAAIGPDLFVPLALQRGWDVKDDKQSPLTVFIDCAGADIPDLPAFQGGD